MRFRAKQGAIVILHRKLVFTLFFCVCCFRPSKMSSSIEGGKVQKAKVSRSERAGTVFPVGRLVRLLRKGQYAQRIALGSGVYLASVLEYLVAELLELAGNAAKDNHRTRINPRYIQLAIQNDEELAALLDGVTIPEGGVRPHINSALIPKKAPGSSKPSQEI